MAVQVIRATRTAGTGRRTRTTSETPTDVLRVAAYARVSTESEEQGSSYEAQCQHYTSYINSHEGWTLAGIYADEGITGTNTKKREQFNKMIADCEAGMIDMVITKSISRWARNTIDSLQSIRKLKALGIGIIFEKENINTLDANGEILITVMSSLAQQESDSISKNVRMGIQYQMQQGKGRLNTAQFLGLTRDPESKTLVIIPEEAALVRRIYREYLEGYSPGMIAAHLTADEIKTPAGKDTWYQTTVMSILQNEKYCGDLLLQKYYVVDFLSHKIVKNNGDLPQYFVEDAHEPIIPKDVFYQVQGEIQRRSLLRYDPNKIRYGSTNALRGRLICGKCGRQLKRYTNPNKGMTDWRCRKRAYTKKSVTKENAASCDCRNVPEKEVKEAIIEAFNQLPGMRDELVRRQNGIWYGELKQLDERLAGISERRKRLEEQLDHETMDGAGNGVSTGDGVSTSEGAEFLRTELEHLEQEYTELVLERAETANREVQIRLLLELVDAMSAPADAHTNTTPADAHTNTTPADAHSDATPAGDDTPACYDYDEFFRRTRYIPDDSILGEDGRIESFTNDLVIRYLDEVLVHDDGYEVKFKAGVRISTTKA